jgi:alpha-ribazole phosphatase
MIQKIYLFRHTTPKIERGYMYGHTDLDVEETFMEEVDAIKKVIPHHQEIPLFSSPLMRCAKLAEALKGTQITFDDRLKEMHFGDWEMKKWDDVEKEELDTWLKNIATMPTPNGESNQQLFKRSVEAWEDITTQAGEELGLVTHFGVIQSLLAYILHIPLEKSFRLDISYGSVIQVSIREKTFFKVKFLK